MSKQAEAHRAAALFTLKEAMRQAERYHQSEKPNMRLLSQKVRRVSELEEELRRSHLVYCEKANVDHNSEDAKKFIEPECDAAIDCVDLCMLTIQESEFEAETNETKQQKIDDIQSALQRHKLQADADERFSSEVVKKITELNVAESYTTDNMVLMRLYNERIQDIFDRLNSAWDILIASGDDKIVNTVEVTKSRMSIQDAISVAVVFIEKCASEEALKTAEVHTSQEDSSKVGQKKVASEYSGGISKLEKIKNPTFSGDIRTFSKFQKDFKRIVEPSYKGAQLSYVLRESCLLGEAKTLVENIDDVDDIWEKLNDRYGDKLHLVEVVIKELNETPALKGGENRKFITMVDLLEKGLQDLDAIGAKSDIANAYVVQMLEGKLSSNLYLTWLKEENTFEGDTRFDKLLKFLKEERRRVEKLVQRGDAKSNDNSKSDKNSNRQQSSYAQGDGRQEKDNCLIHPKVAHFTRKCHQFLAKSALERAEILKTTKGCLLCLTTQHIGKPCPFITKWKPCGVNNCQDHHSRLLHEAVIQGISMHITCAYPKMKNTLLLMQTISTNGGSIHAFFDNGSTITLISTSYVKKMGMKGVRVTYELITVGNHVKTQYTYLHEVTLYDSKGHAHNLQAYEIDNICGEMKCVDVGGVVRLFRNLAVSDVVRQSGQVELLIGMEQIAIHPRYAEEREGVVLFNSMFGTNKVLGGSHHLLSASDNVNAAVVAFSRSRIMNTRVMLDSDPGFDGLTTEQFGVMVPPRCEPCKNCTCTRLPHMSRIEQEELAEIEKNLELDPIAKCWRTKYPYKCDPGLVLQNNYEQAKSYMTRMEKRLENKPEMSEKVNEQFDDFIKRGVYSEISEAEDKLYVGPKFCVTVHEVEKKDSASTPVRLVTHSSLKFKGVCLNDVLMKGPNTLNDIFGVQLKFRCHQIALVCDISKMYHSIKTTDIERHLRRVLYRHQDSTKEFKMYGTNVVQFGDRASAAIAITAVKKTAEIYSHVNPVAADRIINDSYVDDVATGADDHESVKELKGGISEILSYGGFKLKGFVMSGDVSDEVLLLLGAGNIGRVLGIGWDPCDDVYTVTVRINLSTKRKEISEESDLEYDQIPSIVQLKVTKRVLLSIVNSCYDPYGLLVALTIQMRIALREVCKLKVGWDEELPQETKQSWVKILQVVKQAERIRFRRCVRPPNSVGNPQLIVCNDGSELAMCATAHIRWECQDGTVWCQLWCAKARVAPLKKLTIPKIELQSAVLGARLAKSVIANSIWEFSKVHRIVDSECTLATFKKDSVALPEFEANRVQECLNSSNIDEWEHTRSKNNIADLGTRDNATVESVSEGSEWQQGKEWMRTPVDQWPVTKDIGKSHNRCSSCQVLNVEISANVTAKDNVMEQVFDFESLKRHTYDFVVKLVAIVFKLLSTEKSFVRPELSVEDLNSAEAYIIQQSMVKTKELLKKGHLKSLRAEEGADGIIRLGCRALEGLTKCYENNDFPILAYKDPIAFLWMKKVHRENHSGVLSTVARSRRKFWIIKGARLAAQIRRSCYLCRLIDKMLASQLMAPLPSSRQMMSPTFHEISLDLFGPFEIRETVNKRKRKKVWGIIFNCLASRALHIDVTEDYGAVSVIETVRKFTSLRGSPAKIHSDKGSQLLSAAEELKAWALSRKIEWVPVPAEGQHQNGTSEALIKSVKRSLCHVIGANVLTFSSLQMVFYEVADLLNSRPIGIISRSDPTQPTAITPNHLLLGRSTSEVVIGSFDNDRNPNKRLAFLQSIVEDWWKSWYQRVLPSLVPNYKWLQRHRNVQPGDVCLIRYKSELKGTYRLGRVKSVKLGDDGAVRTVKLIYKNPTEKNFREVDRSVHGIAVIVPIEEQSQYIATGLNPAAGVFEPKGTLKQHSNLGQ